VKAPIARSHCQSRPSRELYGRFFCGSLARSPESSRRTEKETELPREKNLFSCVAQKSCAKRAWSIADAFAGTRVSLVELRVRNEMWKWERRWRSDDPTRKVKERERPARLRCLLAHVLEHAAIFVKFQTPNRWSPNWRIITIVDLRKLRTPACLEKFLALRLTKRIWRCFF